MLTTVDDIHGTSKVLMLQLHLRHAVQQLEQITVPVFKIHLNDRELNRRPVLDDLFTAQWEIASSTAALCSTWKSAGNFTSVLNFDSVGGPGSAKGLQTITLLETQ